MLNQLFKPVDTITVPVTIPVIGRNDVIVDMEFKVMSMNEFKALEKDKNGELIPEDRIEELLIKVINSWNDLIMGVPLTLENIRLLVDVNPPAKKAILMAYIEMLTNGKVGNSEKRR